MTAFEFTEQRWQIAVEGKPVSPVFATWFEAAGWASQRGLGVIEPMAALGSKGIVLVHKQPFDTWMDHDIAEFERNSRA